MNIFFGAPRFRLGWILITVAALNALGWTLMRWSHENSYNRAQITLDYDDTKTLADAYRVPHRKLLGLFKERGVASVAIYQQSLATLRDNFRINITPREEAERLFPDSNWKNVVPAYRLLITAPKNQTALLQQILIHLKAQSQESLPPRVIEIRAAQQGDVQDTAQFGIAIPGSRQLMSDAQMGFDPAHVQMVKDAGLRITARLSNPLNLDLERLRGMLDEAQGVGAHVVIFSEDEVLGYNSLIKNVAKEMQKRELLFGNIEFTKQRGWDDFAKQTEGMLVRVHSVGGDEVAKAKVEMLVDRFARAIKERDVRVAYIRLIRQAKGEYAVEPVASEGQGQQFQFVQEKTALQQNLEFVSNITRELRAQPLPFAWLRPGLQMAGATGFGDYPLSSLETKVGGAGPAKWVQRLGLFLTGLGAVGGVLLLLNLFFDLSRRAQTAWLVTGLLLVGVLGMSPGAGAKIMALVTGCVFSTIGLLWGGLPYYWDMRKQQRETNNLTPMQGFLAGCGVLVKTSLITMLGGMFIIALLNHWKFMSKADEFLGEKATQLLPLLLVGLAFAGEVFPHRVIEEGAVVARYRLRDSINYVLNHPFTTRIAVTAVALFVGGSLWIARTGNDSGMEISSTELKMRALLESVFITRPRTKELFPGHPALLFAVWFGLRRQNALALGAVLLATIGQADIVNTFQHIHTPIFYSLLRTIHGIWLGALIGGVLLWLYNLIEPRLSGLGQMLNRDGAGDNLHPPAPVLDGHVDGSTNGKVHLPEADVAVVK